MSELTRKPIVPPEKRRTYIFGDEQQITFENVVATWEKENGTTHRLETTGNSNGNFHIVQSGWKAITLEIDGWSF